jgi:hypothetical protein
MNDENKTKEGRLIGLSKHEDPTFDGFSSFRIHHSSLFAIPSKVGSLR